MRSSVSGSHRARSTARRVSPTSPGTWRRAPPRREHAAPPGWAAPPRPHRFRAPRRGAPIRVRSERSPRTGSHHRAIVGWPAGWRRNGARRVGRGVPSPAGAIEGGSGPTAGEFARRHTRGARSAGRPPRRVRPTTRRPRSAQPVEEEGAPPPRPVTASSRWSGPHSRTTRPAPHQQPLRRGEETRRGSRAAWTAHPPSPSGRARPAATASHRGLTQTGETDRW